MNKGKNIEKFYLLLEILKEYSDQDHPLTRKEINMHMKNKGYEQIKDNRTIDGYVRNLRNFGHDIDVIEENKNYKAYYLASHELETHEIRILSDCIYASKFITKKKSNELVKKLCSLSTIDYRYCIERNSYIDDRSKTMNEEIFYNVDKIERAINENRKILFNYYSYNEDKNFVPRLNEDNTLKQYCINPVSMILQRDKYYLVGENTTMKGRLTNYRIDRIKNVIILEDEIDNLNHIEECKNKFNPVDYTKKSFKMYAGGKVSKVILETSKKLLNVFIDEFGNDVNLEKIDKDLYRVEFEAKISRGLLMWLLQQGHNVKVLYPNILIENIKEEIEKIHNLYKQ